MNKQDFRLRELQHYNNVMKEILIILPNISQAVGLVDVLRDIETKIKENQAEIDKIGGKNGNIKCS